MAKLLGSAEWVSYVRVSLVKKSQRSDRWGDHALPWFGFRGFYNPKPLAMFQSHQCSAINVGFCARDRRIYRFLSQSFLVPCKWFLAGISKASFGCFGGSRQPEASHANARQVANFKRCRQHNPKPQTETLKALKPSIPQGNNLLERAVTNLPPGDVEDFASVLMNGGRPEDSNFPS